MTTCDDGPRDGPSRFTSRANNTHPARRNSRARLDCRWPPVGRARASAISRATHRAALVTGSSRWSRNCWDRP